MTLDTYSEAFKLDCLARWVLQHGRTDTDRGLARRRAWLADYEKRNGKPAADKLKAGMMELTKPVDNLQSTPCATPESPK